MGAAPVTPTKITPHRPIALGFRRSTPDSPAYTDSTMPSWRAPTVRSGFVVAMLPLLSTRSLADEVVRQLRSLNQLPSTVARSGRCSSSVAPEDGVGHEAAHDPVGRVDDLADLEVAGQRAEDVGVRAREAALAAEVVDHRPDRGARRLHEVGLDPGRRVPARVVHARGERARRPPQLRRGQLRVAHHADAHARAHRALEAGDRDLAVTLRGVRVAE